MREFYNKGARNFQKHFNSEKLAQRAHELIVHETLSEEDISLIHRLDYFFLATVDSDGQPQCSYKGGEPGFVKILDPKTIVFPCYDGNGMFLSVGNIHETQRAGLLFLDFENPMRLRVNGSARISTDEALMGLYHEALLTVKVTVETVFINCSRYVHQFRQVKPSEYIPQQGRKTPVPEWKKNPAIMDYLPENCVDK